jgi:acyl-CoA thioesterase
VISGLVIKHVQVLVAMAEANQAEHEQISTALEVENLDENLFRSKSLWVPRRARGAFGGQVISQALVSATNCVDPAYGLHVRNRYQTNRIQS